MLVINNQRIIDKFTVHFCLHDANIDTFVDIKKEKLDKVDTNVSI